MKKVLGFVEILGILVFGRKFSIVSPELKIMIEYKTGGVIDNESSN